METNNPNLSICHCGHTVREHEPSGCNASIPTIFECDEQNQNVSSRGPKLLTKCSCPSFKDIRSGHNNGLEHPFDMNPFDAVFIDDPHQDGKSECKTCHGTCYVSETRVHVDDTRKPCPDCSGVKLSAKHPGEPVTDNEGEPVTIMGFPAFMKHNKDHDHSLIFGNIGDLKSLFPQFHDIKIHFGDKGIVFPNAEFDSAEVVKGFPDLFSVGFKCDPGNTIVLDSCSEPETSDDKIERLTTQAEELEDKNEELTSASTAFAEFVEEFLLDDDEEKVERLAQAFKAFFGRGYDF